MRPSADSDSPQLDSPKLPPCEILPSEQDV